jgi:hypothetical protein
MTEIFFSTVVRSAPPARGGELVRLGWDSKEVIARTPITSSRPDIPDPNPRGNTRGGRGISFSDGRVHVASYDQVRTFDLDLEPISVASNGLMVGLHEVLMVSEGRLWVSATAIDAALEVDLATGGVVNEFWPREDEALRRAMGLEPATIDKSADLRTAFLSSSHTEHQSHLHLNALAIWDGDLHALFNTRGAVVNLSTRQVLLEDPQLQGGHNLVVAENLLFVCATRLKAVCIFDLTSGTLVKTLEISKLEQVQRILRDSRPKGLRRFSAGASKDASEPLFVRGLQASGEDVFVGISPATILHLNWKTGDLLDLYQYSKDVSVCVHGLKVRNT